MARDKGGQGMKAPPVVKYRKNIGTYQRESTNKEVKRVYRDRADARKGKVPYKSIIKLTLKDGRFFQKSNFAPFATFSEKSQILKIRIFVVAVKRYSIWLTEKITVGTKFDSILGTYLYERLF